VRKGRAYKFRVTFARPEDANAASIQVAGPNGFSAEATRTSLRHARGGRYVATYTVSPADGRFDAGDNGSCTIRLRDTAAATTTGAAPAEDSLLGTFTVQAGRERRPILQ